MSPFAKHFVYLSKNFAMNLFHYFTSNTLKWDDLFKSWGDFDPYVISQVYTFTNIYSLYIPIWMSLRIFESVTLTVSSKRPLHVHRSIQYKKNLSMLIATTFLVVLYALIISKVFDSFFHMFFRSHYLNLFIFLWNSLD